jgi:nitrogen fixation protein NifU and related proteins
MTFSEDVLDHFQSPRNVGEMKHADAEAEDENPVCGDRLHMWLRIRDGVVQESTWLAQGCAPAIAAASITSELVRSMPLAEARMLDRLAISEALGGLPARKAHAAMLAASTLHRAIDAYLARHAASTDLGLQASTDGTGEAEE